MRQDQFRVRRVASEGRQPTNPGARETPYLCWQSDGTGLTWVAIVVLYNASEIIRSVPQVAISGFAYDVHTEAQQSLASLTYSLATFICMILLCTPISPFLGQNVGSSRGRHGNGDNGSFT